MTRWLLPLTLAAPLLVVLPSTSAPAADSSSDTLQSARQSLSNKDGAAAASILESALTNHTSSGADRSVLIDLLRQAYAMAADQAEAAGRTRDALNYRENLAILNRARPEATPAAPAPAPAAPAPALPTTAPDSTPSKPEIAPAPPTAPVSLEPGPPALQAAEAVPPGLSPPAESPAASASDSPAPAEQPAETPEALIEKADAAFRERQYSQALATYALLNDRGQLPDLRKDPFAYCRMVKVVEEINKAPQSKEEWESIEREIAAIRQLSPRNWYAEYLRNLAAELSASAETTKRDDSEVVLRGSQPTGEPPTSASPAAPAAPPGAVRPAAAAAIPPLEAPAAAPAPVQAQAAAPTSAAPAAAIVGRPGAPLNGWKVWDTPNFRILHADDAVAPRVAQVAEATRTTQSRIWSGSETSTTWSPRCDIYLYPDARTFAARTGQPADSPGFSTMGLSSGKVVARRINLRADHPNLAHSVLPHEVTHVVLADLFPENQIPRWADEGIAVLAEPDSEQQLRAADLAAPVSKGVLFQLSELMVMDYPDGQHWPLYYAQSVSLTRYLVEQGTPPQFIEFLLGARKAGVEAELKRVYKIDNLAELERQWVLFAKTNSNTALATQLASEAASEAPAAAAAPTRRD